MRHSGEHEIERRLAADRVPGPPADLAERIRAEIPAELPGFPIAEEGASRVRPTLARRLVLAAAGAVIVAGTGLVAWRVVHPGPPATRPGESAEVQPQEPMSPADRVASSTPAAATVAEEAPAAGDEKDGRRLIAAAAVPAAGRALKAAGEATASVAAAPPAKRASAGGVCTLLTVRVVDDASLPLPGAEVTLSRLDATEVAARVAVTNGGGIATFARVPAGTYHLSVSLAGYARVEHDGLVLTADATPSVQVELHATFFEETVVVGEAPPPPPTLAMVRPAESSTAERERRRRDEVSYRMERIVQAPVPGREAKRGIMGVVSPGAVPPSTGGTTEPNDRPYGDVFFQHYGVNPFIDTDEDTLSTFGLDVDTGSYTVARRYLNDGNLPDPASIRVEEWVNYFDYGDRPPRRGDFAITAEGAPTPFGDSDRHRVVRFGIRGRVIDDSHRKPALLTFVIDVSGSMAREDRLGLVKRSLFALLERLRPGDEVALVVYGSRGQVLLEPTADLERIRAAIDRLQPGGSTNAEEGLVLAYDVAGRAYRRDAVNRVILCSDGVANVGRTGPESILARIEREAQRGIELTTVGFGMGNYNDVLMEQLADKGNGRYAYVDSFKEARRIFVENLTGTLQTIAVDARVQVEFNPEVVARYRLLGYENRDIADERFRDDTVDAGEIGAGHAVTALYEIKLHERPARRATVATLRLRYRPAERSEFVEVAHRLTMGDLAPSWEQASPGLRLATLVAEMAEILKGSYWAKGGDLETVFRIAQQLSPAFPGNPDVAELVSLAATAARLEGGAKNGD